MAAMLRDSVVVRTRPRAIPLATITTKKSLHGFPLISHDAYGASPTALRPRPFWPRSSAINSSLHLARTYAGTFVADIFCSEKRTVFREHSSRKTVSFKEQIMFKDKYPSIFPPQMEAIVFIILQILFVTRAVLKIREYLTIILRNRAEYRLILNRRGLRSRRLKSGDIPQD